MGCPPGFPAERVYQAARGSVTGASSGVRSAARGRLFVVLEAGALSCLPLSRRRPPFARTSFQGGERCPEAMGMHADFSGREASHAHEAEGSRSGWGYAIALFGCWLPYWLAFFPGVIATDPLTQWQQITTGRYNSIHPVAHTLLLWVLTRPGHSFGTASLIHIGITAVLFGLVFASVRRLGAPRWLVWMSVTWLILCPAYGWYVIAVWKDNAFGLAVL